MHELSLAEGLLDLALQVARQHGARRVKRALVEIGAMTHAEPETLRFAFEALSAGTLAEGCELETREVALMVACTGCGYEGPGNRELAGCPSCGTLGLTITAGRELRLVHIDIDEAEHAGDAQHA